MFRNWMMRYIKKYCSDKCESITFTQRIRGRRAPWKTVTFSQCDYCEVKRLDAFSDERIRKIFKRIYIAQNKELFQKLLKERRFL